MAAYRVTLRSCLGLLGQEKNYATYGSILSGYYSLAKFREAYAGSVEPCTDPSQWPEVTLNFTLCQPCTKRNPGRPQVSRFKNYMEKSGFALGGGGSSRKGENRCKPCHLTGHRKAGCLENLPKPRYELITSHFDFSVATFCQAKLWLPHFSWHVFGFCHPLDCTWQEAQDEMQDCWFSDCARWRKKLRLEWWRRLLWSWLARHAWSFWTFLQEGKKTVPKKTKTAQPKLKPMRKKVSRQPRKKGALDEDV